VDAVTYTVALCGVLLKERLIFEEQQRCRRFDIAAVGDIEEEEEGVVSCYP
jgi:hypothetical protein